LPYAQSGAMATNPKLAGTAAGIGVFMQNFLGAAFAQLYGLFADGTAVPLAEVTGLSAVFGLCAALIPFLMARKARSQGA
jgi:DHA1 family bicyclomycin/chloramphenicol resistance-like MFS transporter